MNRYRKFLPHVAVALVGVAMLGVPASARAAFDIYLQETGVNGGAITMVGTGADFGTAFFNGTYGDFTVSIFGAASDNGATLSDLLQSTTSVTNNNGSAKTLKLYVSETNYSLPSGSALNVESGLGGSVSTGTVGLTGIYQAYADSTNTLLGTSGFTTGSQSASQTGSTFDTGSATGLFNRDGSDYSLTSVVTFAMSGGGKANYSAHENVTATPAPASLMLAASGVPALALGWLRRRKVKLQNS